MLNELRNKFITNRKYEPLDVNELLDYVRQTYVKNEITIVEYRNIVRELEINGAKKPDYTDEYVEM